MQRAAQPFYLDRIAYYGSKPVYVISICDFRWKRLPDVPEDVHQDWLLWIAPHYKVQSHRSRKPDNVPAIPQKKPPTQHVLISLPTARDVMGDGVNDTLDKLVWILANVGLDSKSEMLPEWTRTDQPAKLLIDQLFYDRLTPEEKFAYDNWASAEAEYEASWRFQVTEDLREETDKQIEEIRNQFEAKRKKSEAELEELKAKLVRRAGLEEELKVELVRRGGLEAELEELEAKLVRRGGL
ncbi:hypothetical protein PTTG_09222 [Puccinia triticina 1-1 BBBD Race 1]|uniref:Uncharacterized protein n=1 Tax=Puccinia triticina (isolate 1-1 / race 1 (BBBD)) TaxID=630390 RepID=A0A180G4V3_PUCT1|nr:hypothetical protein PTTG_09222 [Puccinia triticina 1-1 BBBD Race 1]WAR62528.1 hypothetical protein PtB15_15B113 [Puccinia triticina]